MKPRVLPRALAAVITAALCLSIVPEAAAQRGRAESAAKPAAPAPGQESGREPRRHHVRVGDGTPMVAISDDAYVPKGVVHHDDIVAILGNARVEGEVTGDVVVIMGHLDISGKVRGDVVGIMSPTHIEDTAVIEGDLVSVGGPLERATGSRVDGQEVKLNFMDFIPFMKGGWAGLWRLIFVLKLISLSLLFLAILLITALVPRRLSVIAAAFPGRWGMAILVGLLGYCVTTVLFVILFCTLIGIPLALGLLFAAKGIKWLGLAALFFLMGQTIGRNVFKRDLSHFAAVLGGFAVYALISLVPIFGAVVSTVVSVLALGIAILTRFGSEEGWRKTGAPPALNVTAPPASSAGPPPVYSPLPGS